MPAPRHVLIVEDEPRYRATLVDMVSAADFTCQAAASGEHALRLLREQVCAIAILDLNLPGMDGLSLFEKIREVSPRMQVIILTGFGDLEAARRAIRLDVVDFLTKPCHLGELEQALDRAWRRTAPEASSREATSSEASQEAPPPLADESLGAVEMRHILEVLARHGGNRRATADALGISERTLYYRLANDSTHG